MKKAAFHNLGCKVNAYEHRSMINQLQAAGYTIVDFHEVADVYVINTCVVTATSDQKSRQMLRRAKQKNADAIVVACGCYVQKDADRLQEEGLADLIIGNNEKGTLLEKIESFLPSDAAKKTSVVPDLHADHVSYEELPYASVSTKTRAFLKIQDGCNMPCTYCIIPRVRGKSRSRRMEDIEKEVDVLIAAGYREIVLTGIHLSSFLSPEKKRLTDVISVLQQKEGIKRIRFGSVEPQVFSAAFIEHLAKCDKVCAHFHLSLQSCCDTTLKRMKRSYSVEQIKKAIERIRTVYPRAGLSADIISGFPGETKEEHQASADFLQELSLSDLHVFPFSPREGTPAATMPGQLTKHVRQERANELIQLAGQMRQTFCDSLLGQTVSVLFEEPVIEQNQTFFGGFCEEYIMAYDKDTSIQKGEIRTGKVEKVQDGILYIS